jgi:hypothetical protein
MERSPWAFDFPPSTTTFLLPLSHHFLLSGGCQSAGAGQAPRLFLILPFTFRCLIWFCLKTE